jgi:hypothetical protein
MFERIRNYQVLITGISKADFYGMKENNCIPFHAKYYNGNVVVDKANIFVLKRRLGR